MKFIDKFALVPIDRYNLLVKDKNNSLEGGESRDKEKGSGEKPLTHTTLDKTSNKKEQLNPVIIGEGDTLTYNPSDKRKKLTHTSSEKFPEKRLQISLDGTNYEDNNSPQNVTSTVNNKHTGEVDITTDAGNSKDKKRIKRLRKIPKIVKLPLPPPGIPNRPIKNKFIWLKLF